MEQNIFFEKERVKFLKYLRKNLKYEKIVDSCLWRTCPSHIILKIIYKEIDTSDQFRIEHFIRCSVFTADFGRLADVGFSPAFKIKKESEKEIHYIFEKKLVDEHPHGKITTTMSMGGGFVSYGRDESGRLWEKFFGEQYKLKRN